MERSDRARGPRVIQRESAILPARKFLRLASVFAASTILWTAVLDSDSAFAATYTDEAAWRAAAGVFKLETFDALPFHGSVTNLPGLGVKLDPFALGPPQADTGHLGGSVFQSLPNGLYNSVNDVTSLGPFVIRPLSPSHRIVALGAWNVGLDDTLIVSFFDEHGSLLEQVETPNTGDRIFFGGIISSVPASSVTIAPGVGNGYIGIDDLQVVTQAPSLPALPPIGLGILAGALLVLGLASSSGVWRCRRNVPACWHWTASGLRRADPGTPC